jgi:hypothetical protein
MIGSAHRGEASGPSRCGAVLSRENLKIAAPLKARLQHVEVIVIVFDVENFGGHVADFRPVWQPLWSPCRAHFIRSLPGEAHREHRALAGLALHRDVAGAP